MLAAACSFAFTAAAPTVASGAGSCPAQAGHALALSASASRKAAKAALASAPRLYRELDVRGATVLWSRLAVAAGPRGEEVAVQCGRHIQARTVVVELRFPRELPSSSLAEGVLFISRLRDGYKVWEVAH